ncbi:MAG TPA: xanthine dehydrogenase family protein molybdopterin-binding subunit [Acidimicrobiales bacterium]|nr:xanthine dehydrogenase family protein molybdopterin-binding subunit [Acidimicrobiales bacterium]
MPGSILGNAVRRVEDPEILVGRATYVDNLKIDGILSLVFVRSPVAHGRVLSIDASAAARAPGVVAVYTAADLAMADDTGLMQLHKDVARPPLVTDRVRFVGDTVVAVVGETQAEAVDAAELVVVDYEAIPAVVDPEAALDPAAPLLFEGIGTNLVTSAVGGNSADPLEGADVVVRARFENQRVAVVPMEGSAIAVIPGDDGDGHELTIFVGTQMPHAFWRMQSAAAGIEPGKIRVVAPHVGGAFGAKVATTEHKVAIACALRLGRPVKWVETRSENLVAMPHGRGQVQYVELGLRRDGSMVGLRCRMIGDGGAYGGFGGGLVAGPTRSMAQGVYDIPKISFQAAVTVTNTTPMGAFRGAGRPEAAAFLERIVDMAALELDLDPVELRRKNFLRPEVFPYTTIMGSTYDNGDYDLALREAVRIAGYEDLRAEQAERRRRGDPKLLGIGISSYVEVTAGGGGGEWGRVDIDPDGGATVLVGTSAHGQGHATSFSMIVADRLGIPMERIRFIQSDTALVPKGGGTGGSRSLQLGGSAVHGATEAVLARAQQLVADRIEAAPEDIVVTEDGRLGVAGSPSSAMDWAEVARVAGAGGDPLSAVFDFRSPGSTYPFGAHVAVVEIDSETGLVELVRHVAVDDCGRVLNPLIVEGQQHGGIAQGVAQALFEQFVYDEAGNPLTSTLAEYAMPSAAELPFFEASNTETPTPLNPLGAKGIGESATVGSTPAVQNAVVDALSHLGVRHLNMPCTPERVWRAIEDARTGHLAPPWREPPEIFDALPAPEFEAGDASEELNL